MNSIQKYDADVLIVGGGPSGSMCAYYLAKAGKKVILIDSSNFPRDKICGDFVSPIGLKELINIGIGELDDFKKTNVVTGAAVYIDGQPMIAKNLPNIEGLPNYGRVIPRILLDNWLIEAAKKQGAKVVTPCKLIHYNVFKEYVKIECEQENKERIFYSKLLIGADGSNSIVARKVNGTKIRPENKIIAVRAYFEDINCISQQAELFFTSKSFPGYYWFFPTGKSTANVGIGMMLENFPKKGINLTKLLMDMLQNDVSFKAKIGQGRLVNKVEGFPLSIYNPKSSLVTDRVLLTGDAAGLVNAINGEGIQYAMQSGRWAAESVITCLVSNDLSAKSLKIFEKKVQKEIGFDMSISNVAMQFIRNRNLNPLWITLLKIMINQAKIDEKYANIAGGILSGMVPIRNAIKIYYIRKSFLQGIKYPFKSTNGIFKVIKQSISFAVKSFLESIKQRISYWNWTKEIIKASNHSIFLFFKTHQISNVFKKNISFEYITLKKRANH